MRNLSIDDKLARVREILRSLERVAVAFSAGVDSTFVLKVAVDTLGPGNVVAVTSKSDSLTEAEPAVICGLLGPTQSLNPLFHYQKSLFKPKNDLF